ncbi:hypothetical protein BH09ACT5_BH09ACT5_11470 [soil metagenome]
MTSVTDTVYTQNTKGTQDRPEDFIAEESTVAELRRIDFTGTIWFGAAIIAVAIPLTGLLAQGWRPYDLPVAGEVAWWVGAALTLLGVAGFAWSGCPVLAWPVRVAERQKSITIRGGVALYLVGTVVSLIAILSTPAVVH